LAGAFFLFGMLSMKFFPPLTRDFFFALRLHGAVLPLPSFFSREQEVTRFSLATFFSSFPLALIIFFSHPPPP